MNQEMPGEFDSREIRFNKIGAKTQIFIKLTLREFCGSKLIWFTSF